MSERTKLLKKAVMTGVGATTNGERIKAALNEALEDLVKIGQELFEELESKGKVKTKTAQEFVKNLKEEAGRRSDKLEKQVSSKVQNSMQKAARELGLATQTEVDDLKERIQHLEETLLGDSGASTRTSKKSGTNRGRRPKNS